MFEDDVTSLENALVIQEGLLGVWVGGVMYVIWRMFAFFVLSQYCDQGSSFHLLFLRVDCECNRPSFLATVFWGAFAFNGDLNQWDVAKVTTMNRSKSIRILENDLTWRELMLLWLEGSVGGWGWWWWYDVKMVESWCWRMHYSKMCPSLPRWVLVSFLWFVFCESSWLWDRYEIFFWDFMTLDRYEISLWDFNLMGFIAFWPQWDFLVRFHAFFPS